MTQLALHRFERVMDDFVERFVRTVIHLFLIGHELMPRRDCDVDPTTKRISFLVRVIGLLDGDVTAVDVIAKLLEPRCIVENEIVDLVGFFQAAIRDVNWQLHTNSLNLHARWREIKKCHPERT